MRRQQFPLPVIALLLLLAGCGGTDPAVQPADHAYLHTTAGCTAREVRHSGADNFEYARGYRAHVRTPANFEARRHHPLLVVYAAAAQHAGASERFWRLTRAATARGYIVAYAGSKPLTLTSIKTLASLPAAIARQWCIDPDRTVVLGHSDGGTVAVAASFIDGVATRPAAVIASAAGFTGQDLRVQACPARTPYFVVQKRDDRLFPGYVRELGEWLAACNNCSGDMPASAAGCVPVSGCPDDGEVNFCEIAGGHRTWPDLNDEMLDWLGQQLVSPRAAMMP